MTIDYIFPHTGHARPQLARNAMRNARESSLVGSRATPRRPSPLRETLAVGLTLLLGAPLLACSDSPAWVRDTAPRLEVVHGDGQRGLWGLPLPDPVVVRTVDQRGRPKQGVRVDFEVLEGAGSVAPSSGVSSSEGRVLAHWTLGSAAVRTQRLSARIGDAPGSQALTLQATSLRSEETDQVVFRNALGPLRGVLVVEDDEFGYLGIMQEIATTDTIVPVQLMGPVVRDILMFPQSNIPQRTTLTWTAGIDTLYVELRPPFPLPVIFNVFEGPFDERVAVIQEHMAQTQEIWSRHGMGLVFGDVTFVDRTEGDPEVTVPVPSGCEKSMTPVALIVDYIHRIGDGVFVGYGCGNHVLMGETSERYPSLLAHEIGHLFALEHRPVGLMTRLGLPGTSLTDGEVFRAHFHRQSVLNWLFGVQPQQVRRPCPSSSCLPDDYVLPWMGGS